MGQPAARITDMHVCPMVTGIVPHVGGPIMLGAFTVFTGKLPQARITDMCVCVGPPDLIAKGSSGVFVCKLPAARMGDITAHGGTIVLGCFTVLIGETSGGGGGGGGAGAGAGAGSSASSSGSAPAMLQFAAPTSQSKVLSEAGAKGTPFVEVCFGKGGG